MHGGLTAWSLNPTFRANLKMALAGGGQPWTMSAYLEKDPRHSWASEYHVKLCN